VWRGELGQSASFFKHGTYEREEVASEINLRQRRNQRLVSSPNLIIMKKLFPMFFVGTLSVAGLAMAQEGAPATPVAPAAPAAPAVEVSDEEAMKISSYFFGYRNGAQFSAQAAQGGLDQSTLDTDELVRGIRAGMSGEKPEIEEAKIQASLQKFSQLMQAKEAAAAQANKEAGQKFLEENKSKEGVVTTKSGLQYQILTKGEGAVYDAKKDGAQAKFNSHYKGMLIDGTVFDQSPEGQSIPMTLQVIPGFKEALTTTPTGSKWKLFIPSDLAYGAQRRGQHIGPNETLIFELQLDNIEAAPQPAQGATTPSATTQPIEVPAPKK